MRNTLIIAAVWVGICGPAVAETFDETYPNVIENWCASKSARAPDHRGYNSCIDVAQMKHDYARAIWNELSPERKGGCVRIWNNSAKRVDYEFLIGCLIGQADQQSREEIHVFMKD